MGADKRRWSDEVVSHTSHGRPHRIRTPKDGVAKEVSQVDRVSRYPDDSRPHSTVTAPRPQVARSGRESAPDRAKSPRLACRLRLPLTHIEDSRPVVLALAGRPSWTVECHEIDELPTYSPYSSPYLPFAYSRKWSGVNDSPVASSTSSSVV